MDGLAPDEDTYRSALVALRDTLADGCQSCVLCAMYYLHQDFKLPMDRNAQLLFLDLKIADAPRVH